MNGHKESERKLRRGKQKKYRQPDLLKSSLWKSLSRCSSLKALFPRNRSILKSVGCIGFCEACFCFLYLHSLASVRDLWWLDRMFSVHNNNVPWLLQTRVLHNYSNACTFCPVSQCAVMYVLLTDLSIYTQCNISTQPMLQLTCF